MNKNEALDMMNAGDLSPHEYFKHVKSVERELRSPRTKEKGIRRRRGCIYKELHNHGRRSNGSSDGNRSSCRFVKGVGMKKSYGYRWVAEVMYKKKRYRCRSYSYRVVRDWLDGMIETLCQ